MCPAAEPAPAAAPADRTNAPPLSSTRSAPQSHTGPKPNLRRDHAHTARPRRRHPRHQPDRPTLTPCFVEAGTLTLASSAPTPRARIHSPPGHRPARSRPPHRSPTLLKAAQIFQLLRRRPRLQNPRISKTQIQIPSQFPSSSPATHPAPQHIPSQPPSDP
jgi:hypothetical protein